MGINYYLHVGSRACKECGRNWTDNCLHIGKASAGWCFQLNVHPEMGIHDLEDWLPLFEKHEVRNEYGVEVRNIVDVITLRYYHTAFLGTEEEAALQYANNAMPGPNNLLRSRLGHGCIKHGAGTWDCLNIPFQ